MNMTTEQEIELGEIRNVLHTVRFLIEEMKDAQATLTTYDGKNQYIVTWKNKTLGGDAIAILTKLYYAIITLRTIAMYPSSDENDLLYQDIEDRLRAARSAYIDYRLNE